MNKIGDELVNERSGKILGILCLQHTHEFVHTHAHTHTTHMPAHITYTQTHEKERENQHLINYSFQKHVWWPVLIANLSAFGIN